VICPIEQLSIRREPPLDALEAHPLLIDETPDLLDEAEIAGRVQSVTASRPRRMEQLVFRFPAPQAACIDARELGYGADRIDWKIIWTLHARAHLQQYTSP